MILSSTEVDIYTTRLRILPYTQKQICDVLNLLMDEISNDNQSVYDIDFSMYSQGISEEVDMDPEDVHTIVGTFLEALYFYRPPATDDQPSTPIMPNYVSCTHHEWSTFNDQEDQCNHCDMIIPKQLELNF